MVEQSLFINKEEILAHGEKHLRKDVLDILEAGVKSVVPYESTRSLVQTNENSLFVGDMEIPFDSIRAIYVVGAGKGSFPIAQALDEILGSRISRGFVAVKEGEKRSLKYIETFESSHPIPDKRSVEAANRIFDILKGTQQGDLLFAAITGGASALVNMPWDGISIEDLENINMQLLKSGADINMINTVRKHLCRLKGGRLVCHGKNAKIITLTLNTAPPGMPWPDMCLPDPSTFQDAIAVLKLFKLWESAPESIQKHFLKGLKNPKMETPKELNDIDHHIFSVADPQLACTSAAQKAAQLGYTPHILSTTMEGEAKDLGIFYAGIANEINAYGRPFTPPCAIISGGETTVTINGPCGQGGPNQETVIGFISKIRAKSNFAFGAMDTDGTDGPVDIAGGIADYSTLPRLKEMSIDLHEAILFHRSSEILRLLGDALLTGHTGTNVMNLRVVLIDKHCQKVKA
jgi:glycerate-2-kinase